MAKQPAPLELLQEKLSRLKSAKRHSKDDFEKGIIDSEIHAMHIHNLNPLINEYEEAIELLKINLKEK